MKAVRNIFVVATLTLFAATAYAGTTVDGEQCAINADCVDGSSCDCVTPPALDAGATSVQSSVGAAAVGATVAMMMNERTPWSVALGAGIGVGLMASTTVADAAVGQNCVCVSDSVADSNPGIGNKGSVSAQFVDSSATAFVSDASGKRRQRRDYIVAHEMRYGDAKTGAGTAPVPDIESFKVAILEIVMCKKAVTADEGSSVAMKMGLGTANGANTVKEQYEKFDCETLCEASPGAAAKDTYATGWHETNTETLQKQTDTQARVDNYEKTLDWLDLKDPDSLAAFKDKCKSTSFPTGTYHWGWVVYAPIGKMKASIKVDEDRTLYTHASEMEGKAVLNGDSSVSAAAMSEKSFLEGPSDETSFWVADSGNMQQNFYSYTLTEPLTMLPGEDYTLSLAFDLESVVDGFAGVSQPCSYPDHPCDRSTGFTGEKYENGMSGMTEETMCRDLAYVDWTRLPASDCLQSAYNKDQKQYDEWRLYSLLDHSFNAIDVGYLQLTPLLHKASDEIWRQRYSLDLNLELAAARENNGLSFMSGESIVQPRRGCEAVVQLLYAMPAETFVCPPNSKAIGTPVESDADCMCTVGFLRNEAGDCVADTTMAEILKDFPTVKTLVPFVPIFSLPAVAGRGRRAGAASSCTFCADMEAAAAVAATKASVGPTIDDAPVAASYSMSKCYYRERGSRASNQQMLSPRVVKAKHGSTGIELFGGWTPWMSLIEGFDRMFTLGQQGTVDLTCATFDGCHQCAYTKKWTKIGIEGNANCYDMAWGPGFPNQDAWTECNTQAEMLTMLDGMGSNNKYKCTCADGTDGGIKVDGPEQPQAEPPACNDNCWEFDDAACERAKYTDVNYTLTDVGLVKGLAAITETAVVYCDPVADAVQAATAAGCLEHINQPTALGTECGDACNNHLFSIVNATEQCIGKHIKYPVGQQAVLIDDAMSTVLRIMVESLNDGNCTDNSTSPVNSTKA